MKQAGRQPHRRADTLRARNGRAGMLTSEFPEMVLSEIVAELEDDKTKAFCQFASLRPEEKKDYTEETSSAVVSRIQHIISCTVSSNNKSQARQAGRHVASRHMWD